LTGIFFQTMAQTGMAAAGTAISMGAGGAAPAVAGVSGGISAAGQALSAPGIAGAGFVQKAGAALGGFGGAFWRPGLYIGQNMLLMGTVGTLGGLGASRAASSINRAIDFKTSAQAAQTIMAHRGGMLANEFGLTDPKWNGRLTGALAAGMNHEEIRERYVQYPNQEEFWTHTKSRINDLKGK
jgi:hypothetical protein